MTAHAPTVSFEEGRGSSLCHPEKDGVPLLPPGHRGAPGRSPLFGPVSGSAPGSTPQGRSAASVLEAPGACDPSIPVPGTGEWVGARPGPSCEADRHGHNLHGPLQCEELRKRDSFTPRMRAQAPERRGKGRSRGTVDRKREKRRSKDRGHQEVTDDIDGEGRERK